MFPDHLLCANHYSKHWRNMGNKTEKTSALNQVGAD